MSRSGSAGRFRRKFKSVPFVDRVFCALSKYAAALGDACRDGGGLHGGGMRLFPLPALLALLAIMAPLRVAAETAKAVAAEEKEEEMGVIKGLEIARANGGFLGVTADGVSLVVTFYDKKKKPVKADAVRVNARWTDRVKARSAVLLPEDASTFKSPPVLKPPYRYVAFLVLIGADEKAMETYSINLNSVE